MICWSSSSSVYADISRMRWRFLTASHFGRCILSLDVIRMELHYLWGLCYDWVVVCETHYFLARPPRVESGHQALSIPVRYIYSTS